MKARDECQGEGMNSKETGYRLGEGMKNDSKRNETMDIGLAAD